MLTARLTEASRSFEGVLDRQAHVTESEVDWREPVVMIRQRHPDDHDYPIGHSPDPRGRFLLAITGDTGPAASETRPRPGSPPKAARAGPRPRQQ